MKHVIGIDAGGTKTRLKLADLEGTLLAECEGGPANVNSVESQALEKTLAKLLEQAEKLCGAASGDCEAVCLGAAGAGRPEERSMLEGIIARCGVQGKVFVTDDAYISLYGALEEDRGIIIISGTGSICYGRSAAGAACRAGGWGHIIGDEGSGYDIGLRALKHTVRCADGRDRGGLLAEAVLRRLGLGGADELVRYVYRSGAGKTAIAALAGTVEDACAQGDAAARGILEDAAKELFICAESVIRKLCFHSEPGRVALSGGILTNCAFVREGLVDRLKGAYPHLEPVTAKHDAAWGAVLKALDIAGELY